MKKKNRLYPLISLLLLLPMALYYGNNTLDITNYTINHENLSGLRILHLSDLHNKEFGREQTKILNKIYNINPDLIVFTGDLVDARRPGYDKGLILMQKLSKKYPIYRVNGNHDYSENGYQIQPKLDELKVHTLENSNDTFYYKDIPILITGVHDPKLYKTVNRKTNFNKSLDLMDSSTYNLLLSHRPEYYDTYVNKGYDLVLSGHSHGGQIRIPFFKGLIAPHQGIFPKYAGGVYTTNNTTMIVSRGLGNSLFPFRIFNNPELVIIDFK